MNKVQLITIMFASLFLIQVIYYSTRNKLRDKQAFLWFLLAVIGLFIAIFLEPLNKVAAVLGVSYMPTLIFTIAFLVVLNALIYQSITLSDHQEKIKTLVQEIAYIKHELQNDQRKEEKDESC
ncbi:DUF2304 domain-containing protein [Saccharococcus caldoxylosilyticus]|jgi:hypothetical protein|uniref:DUF2304 domain-containing protein n=2 Tax=Saccharococcus caldoxylosilyticus TaxID=81408 RepID=A0A023DDA2_9BACL|nr:DUF2304 domain-containing protein [Parageobacillus caldoxylosilyticus]OQO99567.1 hypothetical protein BSK33_14990 [Geobacillus sp. 44B]KYD16938.1 hypothetical protein B4119_3636 [Parageobacillus caldoxylosilyticus]MBB3852565.1 hypothetical protein [Parageobacillus caldoxylosilyticus]QNU38966.1 DUF2304 domain-containing protein [Geobacillus sp. 44B]QXJ38770.1 hypothetical protein BV455_02114 [Parageobacillus caldoxylosilyticus]